jgi:hypothetical protein
VRESVGSRFTLVWPVVRRDARALVACERFPPLGAPRYRDHSAVTASAVGDGSIRPGDSVTEFGLGFSVFEVGGITAGPDGNVYFTVGDNNGEQVGRLTPAGNITFLSLPGGVDPGAITTGPDGNLWVTDPTDDDPEEVAGLRGLDPDPVVRGPGIPTQAHRLTAYITAELTRTP